MAICSHKSYKTIDIRIVLVKGEVQYMENQYCWEIFMLIMSTHRNFLASYSVKLPKGTADTMIGGHFTCYLSTSSDRIPPHKY